MGVTGSGKTEVYLRAAQAAMECGKQTLVLVPEISLTHQLVREFRSRFGECVAVLHSRLSKGERAAVWRGVRRGGFSVVLGARSAVFAPCRKLGLIIVDEEHDPAYKHEEGFRYNARDLAMMRGKLSPCPVLLGSATPSMETYCNARQGRFRMLRLPERVGGGSLPQTQIVDLRRSFKAGRKRQVISPPLEEAMSQTLEKGEQVLLFFEPERLCHFLALSGLRSCLQMQQLRGGTGASSVRRIASMPLLRLEETGSSFMPRMQRDKHLGPGGGHRSFGTGGQKKIP